MYPPSSKTSPRSQQGVNSSKPENLAPGPTPNTAPSTATAGSDVKIISVGLRYYNVSKKMVGQQVRSMEEFCQAGKALFGIPADESVNFVVQGRLAQNINLDEFARMVPELTLIHVVSRSSKKN